MAWKICIATIFAAISSLGADEIRDCLPPAAESLRILNEMQKSDYDQTIQDGIDLFCALLYEEALEKFNFVISAYAENHASEMDFGTALWGKTLCDGALEQMDDFYQDLEVMDYFFLERPQCQNVKSSPHETQSTNAHVRNPDIILTGAGVGFENRAPGVIPPANVPVKFGNPNEQISIQDCIDRVKGTADLMRAGAMALKRREVIWLLNNFIARIEDACYSCCRTGAFWTNCLTPIIEKLNKWQIFGIPNDPAWD